MARDLPLRSDTASHFCSLPSPRSPAPPAALLALVCHSRLPPLPAGSSSSLTRHTKVARENIKHCPSRALSPREAAAAPAGSACAPPPTSHLLPGGAGDRRLPGLPPPSPSLNITALCCQGSACQPWSPGHRCCQPQLTGSVPSTAACPVPALRDTTCLRTSTAHHFSPRCRLLRGSCDHANRISELSTSLAPLGLSDELPPSQKSPAATVGGSLSLRHHPSRRDSNSSQYFQSPTPGSMNQTTRLMAPG